MLARKINYDEALIVSFFFFFLNFYFYLFFKLIIIIITTTTIGVEDSNYKPYDYYHIRMSIELCSV